MAKAASSDVFRRLHHLFRTKKATPKTATPAAAVSLQVPKSKTDTSKTEGKFEKLAEEFKERSSSPWYRGKRWAYFAIVRRLSRGGHFSLVDEILQHQKQYPDIKNEHFVSRLIILYGQAKMVDHALHLFDEMPALNCPRTVLSFNALLAACFPSGNYDKAVELFRDLPTKLSIDPDVISYTSAMKALCRKGSTDDAVSLLEEMEAKCVPLNVTTFGILLNHLYYSGRLSEGENTWNLMREKNVDPDLTCYNARLLGMVSQKRFSEAVDLVKEVEEKGLKPNDYTYNVLIKGFKEEGNIEEVRKWYKVMEKSSDAAPNIFTFVRIIPLAMDTDIDFAFELCKKSASLKKKVSRNLVRKVSDELVKQDKAEEAKELLQLYNFTPLSSSSS